MESSKQQATAAGKRQTLFLSTRIHTTVTSTAAMTSAWKTTQQRRSYSVRTQRRPLHHAAPSCAAHPREQARCSCTLACTAQDPRRRWAHWRCGAQTAPPACRQSAQAHQRRRRCVRCPERCDMTPHTTQSHATIAIMSPGTRANIQTLKRKACANEKANGRAGEVGRVRTASAVVWSNRSICCSSLPCT